MHIASKVGKPYLTFLCCKVTKFEYVQQKLSYSQPSTDRLVTSFVLYINPLSRLSLTKRFTFVRGGLLAAPLYS